MKFTGTIANPTSTLPTPRPGHLPFYPKVETKLDPA